MKIWVDTAVPDEIEQWNEHPWVSGFTTNPTLVKQAGAHPRDLVKLTEKPISIDGPPEKVWDLGEHVYVKVCAEEFMDLAFACKDDRGPINFTAVCKPSQVLQGIGQCRPTDVVSVFAGRIMDTGRNPGETLDAARRSGGNVLWASVREPHNITDADNYGCHLVTVPPAILRKYLDWHGKPLEVVAEETIAQFARDAEGVIW